MRRPRLLIRPPRTRSALTVSLPKRLPLIRPLLIRRRLIRKRLPRLLLIRLQLRRPRDCANSLLRRRPLIRLPLLSLLRSHLPL